MSRNIRQLLHAKGSTVWVVQPDQTAEEAVQIMVERNVSALLVRDQSGVVGIISERDLVRSVAGRGLPFNTTTVDQFMTRDVHYLNADQTIDQAMELMTTKEVRHLPVLDEKGLVGMVSVRDLIKEVVADKDLTIRKLEEGHSRH